MQESNPDINLSTRLERGSPENWFSEKNFIDHLCFKMGFDLNTNEVATFSFISCIAFIIFGTYFQQKVYIASVLKLWLASEI